MTAMRTAAHDVERSPKIATVYVPVVVGDRVLRVNGAEMRAERPSAELAALASPADDAAWIMTHGGEFRLARPAERARGPLAGAADQYDLLADGQLVRVEARKRVIDGARHVARREFVRFADVDEHAGPGVESFGEFVMPNLVRVCARALGEKV